MTNKQIVEKADFSNADLVTAGLLNPEQANRFVRKLIEEPTLLRDVRVVEMKAPQRKINKIQFNKRILRAGTSATALDTAAIASGTPFDPVAEATARAKLKTEQIELNTSEVIAEVQIPYDVVEDNIEMGSVGQMRDVGGSGAGGGFLDTTLMLMAERAALDLEELAILGDDSLGAADTYLDLQNGYVELVRDGGNVNDHGDAAIDKTLFKNAKKTLPDQYLRNLNAMRHYVSHDQETEYRDAQASRGTALGDATLEGDRALRAFGTPIVPNSTIPDDEALFSNPMNFIWGVQRQMMLEWDKNIQKRLIIVVLTARVAIQVEEAEAAVLSTNIGAP